MRVVRVIAALCAVGCSTHLNPDFCRDHPDQCATADAGAGPAKSDGDCDSQAALPDGTCAVEADVIYAAADGVGSDCSKAIPCSLDTAFGELPAKQQLHVAAGSYAVTAPIALPNAGAHYRLFGPGRSFNQPLTAGNATDVELDFLEITGSPGVGLACANAKVTGVALWIHDNADYGVQAAPCTLSLSRSTFAHDAHGAVFVNQGVVDISTNLFVGNGDPADDTATAVQLQAATGTVAFNTIAYNHQGPGAQRVAGMHCQTAQLMVTGNIVTANDRAGAFRTQADGGGCDYSTSYTAPGSSNNDLAFNAIDGSPTSFRLTVGSTPVIDVPGLTMCAGVDIDGDARPQGKSCDDGADEFAP